MLQPRVTLGLMHLESLPHEHVHALAGVLALKIRKTSSRTTTMQTSTTTIIESDSHNTAREVHYNLHKIYTGPGDCKPQAYPLLGTFP